MVDIAAVRRGERVVEIGTGMGALTRELVRLTPAFEGYEVDEASYLSLRKEMGESVVLHNEDAFASSPTFDVLISSLPYSESSRFVEWLAKSRYERAVVLLQEDFARKITAPPGSPAYRAVSVVAQASADVEIVSRVGRSSFDPPPRVNSCLVTMKWKRSLSLTEIALIKKIFSQKRRTVRAALRNLGMVAPLQGSTAPENVKLQCRVNALRPQSVLAMVGALTRSERSREGKALD